MNNRVEPVKIGIIGLGRAGYGMHCKELRDKKDQFQIIAGCDPVVSRLETLSQEFGSKGYECVEDLVNDSEVELVDIASRSSDHYAHGMLALEAGKDIVLEKPMTLNVIEAEHLVETAIQKGRRIYVRHNRRYDPDFLHAMELIDSGILGEIHTIKLYRHSYQRRNDWQTLKEFGGGQLLNWGPHIIDHALCLLQSPIKHIWSHLDLINAAGDAEDHIKLILTGENGRVADIEISGGMALPSPTFQIYGTKGSLSISGKEIRLKYLHPDVQLQPLNADPRTPPQMGTFNNGEELKWVEEVIPVSPAIQHNFWEELYRSVRFRESFRIQISEAMDVVKVISQVKRNTQFESYHLIGE